MTFRHNFSKFLLSLPGKVKISLAIFFDILLVIFSSILSFYLRFDFATLDTYYPQIIITILVSACLVTLIFFWLNLYREVIRYAGLNLIKRIFRAISVYTLIFLLSGILLWEYGVPRSVMIIQPLILIFLISISRLGISTFFDRYKSLKTGEIFDRKNVLIYGAGNEGQLLASNLLSVKEFHIIGFIDDNISLHNRLIGGLRVYPGELTKTLLHSFNIKVVYLSLPNKEPARRDEIIRFLKQENVAVRIVPFLGLPVRGGDLNEELQDIYIEDLLGRDVCLPIEDLSAKNIQGKAVLITGAGGSIGSELARQCLELSPKALILIDNSEYSLYRINENLTLLRKKLGLEQLEIIPILGSVLNAAFIERITSTYQPFIIFHAAAFKHVPMVEHNIISGVENNVFGTLNISKSAIKNNISNVVLISTDKAVRPTNIMGASKRLAEMIFQSAHEFCEGKTIFSIVRFGNVLGSSGSVVPLFREQIKTGGPVTVTHRDVVRFFMTIPEAVGLVIQAGAIASGGEIFILNMGSPIKIHDLAEKIIKLSGSKIKNETSPDGDIEIIFTGLRPGEKLYEELSITGVSEATIHPQIIKSMEEQPIHENLELTLNKLKEMIHAGDVVGIQSLLVDAVKGYTPLGKIVDYEYRGRRKSDDG